MRRSRRRVEPVARASTPNDRSGVEFGWKAHDAIQDWTRSVDTKASISLVAISGLGLFAANQVLNTNGFLYDPVKTQLWLVRAMGLCFLLAGVVALSVIFPSLKRELTKQRAASGLIFFGHLRHRESADIARSLSQLTASEEIDQLADQLQVTASVAWRKHARLQAALVFLAVAVALFATAAVVDASRGDRAGCRASAFEVRSSPLLAAGKPDACSRLPTADR